MVEPIPAGSEGFIPHLVCSPATDALEFYKKAFGAVELQRMPAPDGRLMHASMKVGDVMFFMADDFPEHCGGRSATATSLGGTPVTIHRYVKNCDAAFDQAVSAGATPELPPTDMFWGDRYCLFRDPFGHRWSLATHLQDLAPEQVMEGMKKCFEEAPTA